MANINISDQYKYTGRGPFDAKALVKDYATLLSKATWTVDGTEDGNIIAYNGMITAVWLNKDDTTKNGIYFLFDPLVVSTIKKPDVTLESNWHKFAELSDLTALSEQLAAMNDELTGVKTRLATLEEDKVVIRRDNEYNYLKKTPANNEICLVDVAGKGVRVKIGDGETTFAELPYLDESILKSVDNIIIKGYFYQNNFYADSGHTKLIEALIGRIYIDTASSKLYTYNGVGYDTTLNKLPNATADVAGMLKLYDQTGQNIDGTMTQRAITNEFDNINDELDDKFEMDVIKDEEMLIFDRDLF